MLEITKSTFIVTQYSRAIGSEEFEEQHYTFERSKK
jgi:hypothetical protein